jgi:hypothetical protein
MKEIDTQELVQVTGGRRTATSRRVDPQLELALTKLSSDIREIARPQQNTQTFALMAAAVAMSRHA